MCLNTTCQWSCLVSCLLKDFINYLGTSLLRYVIFLLFLQSFPSLKHFGGALRVKPRVLWILLEHFSFSSIFSQFALCLLDSLERRHENKDHRCFRNMHWNQRSWILSDQGALLLTWCRSRNLSWCSRTASWLLLCSHLRFFYQQDALGNIA